MTLNADQWTRLRAELTARVDDLAAMLLPNGHKVGGKWVAGDAHDGDGDSLNLALSGDKVGQWFDHGNAADGEKSGDLVTLAAIRWACPVAEAGARLWTDLGLDLATPAPTPPPGKRAPRGKGGDADDLVPAPGVAPGDPSWEWALDRGLPGEDDGAPPVRADMYQWADGSVAFRVLRYNRPTVKDPKGKEFRPLAPFMIDGRVRWKYRDPPGVLPLLNLPAMVRRPDAVVIVCEGEKAAEAAALLGDHVATSPAHGAKAPAGSDWSVLHGRRVLIWPDYDKPGAEFAAVVAGLVPGSAIIDVAALARSVGWDIKPKDDAADVPEELHAAVVRALLAPPLLAAGAAPSDPAKPASPPPPKVPPPTDDDDDDGENANRRRTYRRVVASIAHTIEQSGIWPNALNGWRRRDGEVWRPADTGDDELQADFVHAWRLDGRPGERVIPDAWEKVVRDMRRERRAELVRSMTGEPSTAEGLAALRTWVRAVAIGASASVDPGWAARQEARLDFLVAVMRHWLWSVKRYALGLSVSRELMVVLFGPQASGKTWAVEALAAPWEELSLPITAAALTDERQAQVLYRGLIARWDELEGAHKADVDALKRSITSKSVAFRNLYSNAVQERLRTCSFIASTNLPVRQVIKDTTGSRRYVEIETPARCDWDALNALDMRLVWRSVCESDPAPILDVLPDLAGHQRLLVHQDAVCAWLMAETWDTIVQRSVDGLKPETLPAYDAARGITMDEMARRHAHWARQVGQAAFPIGGLGARFRQLGFSDPVKVRGTPSRPSGRYYFIPADILDRSAAWMGGIEAQPVATVPDVPEVF